MNGIETPGWNPPRKRLIRTQKEWEEFIESEGGQDVVFGDKWYETLQKVTRDGPIEIDVDALDPIERRRARGFLINIEGERNRIETGNANGITCLHLAFAIAASVIFCLGLLLFGE